MLRLHKRSIQMLHSSVPYKFMITFLISCFNELNKRVNKISHAILRLLLLFLQNLISKGRFYCIIPLRKHGFKRLNVIMPTFFYLHVYLNRVEGSPHPTNAFSMSGAVNSVVVCCFFWSYLFFDYCILHKTHFELFICDFSCFFVFWWRPFSDLQL